MTQRFPASKQWTVSVSFITQFTRGALRSFRDAKMRNTVSKDSLSDLLFYKHWNNYAGLLLFSIHLCNSLVPKGIKANEVIFFFMFSFCQIGLS